MFGGLSLLGVEGDRGKGVGVVVLETYATFLNTR